LLFYTGAADRRTVGVSALTPYDCALLHNKLPIVNPTDKKVVDVIARRG
jgi:hypothetical protein